MKPEEKTKSPEHPKGRELSERLRSQIRFEKTWVDEVADVSGNLFGSVWFLISNAVFFASWIVYNTPEFGFAPFDPYPFGLLTMIVSLEAIFLSVVVLISQNRQSRVADIRQRVNFEIDVLAEDEVTKILKMLEEIRTHLGIQKKDAELARMEKKTDIGAIQRKVEEAG